MSKPAVRSFACAAIVSLLFAAAAAAQSTGQWVNVAEEGVTAEQRAEEAARVEARLATISASPAPGSNEDRVRKALQRRVSLLSEVEGALDRAAALETAVARSRGGMAELRARLRTLDAAPEVAAPNKATVDALREKEQQASVLQEELESLTAQSAAFTARVVSGAEERAKLEARLATANERIKALEAEIDGTAQGGEFKPVALELANSRLARSLVNRLLKILRSEQSASADVSAYYALAIDVAKREAQRADAVVAAYRRSVRDRASADRRALESRLEELEAEVEKLEAPGEKFLASWELRLVRSKKSRADLQALMLTLAKDTEDQERRLAEDRNALARLRETLDQYGTTAQAAQLVRENWRRIPQKRRSVDYAVKPTVEEQLAAARERRFVVDNTLYDLTESWRSGLAAASAGLDKEAAASLKSRSAEKRDQLRAELNEEKAALTEAIARGQRLESVALERRAAVDELETFIRTRVLWIRDREPVSPAILPDLRANLQAFGSWLLIAGSPETVAKVGEELQAPGRIVYLLVVLLLAPVLFVAVRRGLSRFAQSQREQASRRLRVGQIAARVVVELSRTVVAPAYLLFVAVVIDNLGLSHDIDTIAATVVRVFALFTLLRSLVRLLFGKNSLLVEAAGLKREVAASVYRPARVALFAMIGFGIPWAVLSSAPFEQRTIPHVLAVGFLIVAGLCAYRVFHPGSLLITQGTRGITAHVMQRWRGSARLLVPVLIFGPCALLIAGYGFAAGYLTWAITMSFIAATALPPLYRMASSVAGRIQAHRRAVEKRAAEQAERDGETPDAPSTLNLVTAVRAAFVLVSVYLVALVWGIDEQAWKALEAVHLWEASSPDDTPRFVSAADVILVVAGLVGTGWVLRNLPSIYDLTLFPRFRFDTGVRYAIVTMSRYGLVFIVVWWLTGVLKLDTAKLGWLIAAMGVGLGFGLQEIVSNFVSGIILLVERPIRVGDQVTVGNVTGRVQRINIRATTVLNFDRQEVLVPNRSLITQEVINWTLMDNITRLVISIGVDYGSDIELVKTTLMEIAKRQPEVLKDPAPSVVFVNHGDSALLFDVRVFLSDVSYRPVVQDRMNTEINAALTAKDIGIPFPQRDLHIKSWPAGTPVAAAAGTKEEAQ